MPLVFPSDLTPRLIDVYWREQTRGNVETLAGEGDFERGNGGRWIARLGFPAMCNADFYEIRALLHRSACEKIVYYIGETSTADPDRFAIFTDGQDFDDLNGETFTDKILDYGVTATTGNFNSTNREPLNIVGGADEYSFIGLGDHTGNGPYQINMTLDNTSGVTYNIAHPISDKFIDNLTLPVVTGFVPFYGRIVSNNVAQIEMGHNYTSFEIEIEGDIV